MNKLTKPVSIERLLYLQERIAVLDGAKNLDKYGIFDETVPEEFIAIAKQRVAINAEFDAYFEALKKANPSYFKHAN